MAMNFSDGIRSFFNSLAKTTFRKHLLLVVALIIVMIGVAAAAGWFAKGEAVVFLCQYDIEVYPNCEEELGLKKGNAIGESGANSNAAKPQPTESVTPTVAATPDNTNLSSNPKPSPSTTEPGTTAGSTPAGGIPPVVAATPVPLTPEQKVRLASQETQIRNLIKHHGRVMAFFYQAYYIALLEVLLLGVVVAISLFAIAQDGWASANSYVKTVFIVASAGVAFFGLWPPVFEQQKNISDNKVLFLQYQALKNELNSFPVIRTNTKNEVKDANAFIAYIDSELARLGNIAVGFDYTKIDYKGAFNLSPNQPAATPGASPPGKK
ncbi:MAG TPA: hypothetical protein VMS31_22605 [Pyrinomonadaceae bacterium]|nr:hypothetical protein [Pyrinomonadaceae bacterium]